MALGGTVFMNRQSINYKALNRFSSFLTRFSHFVWCFNTTVTYFVKETGFYFQLDV